LRLSKIAHLNCGWARIEARFDELIRPMTLGNMRGLGTVFGAAATYFISQPSRCAPAATWHGCCYHNSLAPAGAGRF
jgi:hypothetical protein